ncbi:MAG: hypothetical protein LAP40_15155 [Acidobacteriia bacterium]|nr:hypothetical protein [Terriglobia bacterium]
MKHSMVTAVIASTVVWLAASPPRLAAQARSTETANAAKTVSPAPRMPDGHPDLSGVWWRGADIGGRGGAPLAGPRGGGRGTEPPPTFAGLYQPWAQAKAKTLRDKDDPALSCTSTAFGTLNVSLFDVGAVGQIVQTPKFVIMLSETYHGYQSIPTDGRPHRDTQPPANRGDAVGHWEGDTLVVDKTNFTDTSWISAEGRVSFHSDALHIVERYHRVDANTLEIEATLEDPKVLTKPWIVPKQTLVLAPFDQLLTLDCSGEEVKSLIDAAQKDPVKN